MGNPLDYPIFAAVLLPFVFLQLTFVQIVFTVTQQKTKLETVQ